MASRIALRAGRPPPSTPASRAPPVPVAPPTPVAPPVPTAPPGPAGAPPVDATALPPAPVVALPPVPELRPPPWLEDVHAASSPLAASAHNHRLRVPRTVRRSPGLTRVSIYR